MTTPQPRLILSTIGGLVSETTEQPTEEQPVEQPAEEQPVEEPAEEQPAEEEGDDDADDS
jgi:hypothetical protein